MKAGAIAAFIVGGLWLLITMPLLVTYPPLVRDNLVSMAILPGGLIALGVYLWKKAHPEAAIDAELVDDPPQNPPD